MSEELLTMKNNLQLATQQAENLPVAQGVLGPQVPTMWNTPKLMNMAWKMAGVLAETTSVPSSYQKKPGDCLLAIDIANRMGISPLMVMQSSQVVKGHFTWTGPACRALIDGSGKFVESRYVFVGTPKEPEWGCYFEAKLRKTGEVIRGTTITMGMAKNEGWLNKDGSKWKTMPEQMLKYRAASFFAKTECPEVLMGFQTTEEIEDITPDEKPETIKMRLEDVKV